MSTMSRSESPLSKCVKYTNHLPSGVLETGDIRVARKTELNTTLYDHVLILAN